MKCFGHSRSAKGHSFRPNRRLHCCASISLVLLRKLTFCVLRPAIKAGVRIAFDRRVCDASGTKSCSSMDIARTKLQSGAKSATCSLTGRLASTASRRRSGLSSSFPLMPIRMSHAIRLPIYPQSSMRASLLSRVSIEHGRWRVLDTGCRCATPRAQRPDNFASRAGKPGPQRSDAVGECPAGLLSTWLRRRVLDLVKLGEAIDHTTQRSRRRRYIRRTAAASLDLPAPGWRVRVPFPSGARSVRSSREWPRAAPGTDPTQDAEIAARLR